MSAKYDRVVVLGEGVWGQVFKAIRKSDGLEVAVKRIKSKDKRVGVDFTALREVKYMQEIRDQHIVDLLEVYLEGGSLHLVLEFCPYNLENVIRDKSLYLKSSHIKCYVKMLLEGIRHCHDHFVLHRDLKPANILFSSSGALKLADFGLARGFGSPVAMTAEVVTLWYRAPELLFGARHYSGAIDMWAVGCIFAEIALRTPLFTGTTEVEQLAKIFNVRGTPTDANWPGAKLLPNYVEFEFREAMDLSSLFHSSHSEKNVGNSNSNGGASGERPRARGSLLLELLLEMLTLNPSTRISAKGALQHDYFQPEHLPTACLSHELPVPEGIVLTSSSTHPH